MLLFKMNIVLSPSVCMYVYVRGKGDDFSDYSDSARVQLHDENQGPLKYVYYSSKILNLNVGIGKR